MPALNTQLFRCFGDIPVIFFQDERDKYLFHFIPEGVQLMQGEKIVVQVPVFFFSRVGIT